MFIGEYEHRLDAKNRLSIPRKFRDHVEETEERKGFYVTLGLDNCLFLYTPSQWGEVSSQLRDKPFTDPAARRFKRLFFSNATYAEIDSQGRVLVPDKLKRAVGLNKNVTVVGVHSHVEVWARNRWKEASEADESEYEELAERLGS